MSYLEKYDNFVMKKCLDTRRINTFELNNLANGRVTKSHFGGYVAQKPLSAKDLVIGLSKHGFKPDEVLKGLDINELLFEINRAGVQIEQILNDDLPSDDEESQGEAASPDFPYHTPYRTQAHRTPEQTGEPEWLRQAGVILQSPQRIQTPEAQTIGDNKTPAERQASRGDRRFPTLSKLVQRFRDLVSPHRYGSQVAPSPEEQQEVAPSPEEQQEVAPSTEEELPESEPDDEEEEPDYESDVSQGTEPDENPDFNFVPGQAHAALVSEMTESEYRVIPGAALAALAEEMQRNRERA